MPCQLSSYCTGCNHCSICSKAAEHTCCKLVRGNPEHYCKAERDLAWVVPITTSVWRVSLKCIHLFCLLWMKANKTWPNLPHSLPHPAATQHSGLSPNMRPFMLWFSCWNYQTGPSIINLQHTHFQINFTDVWFLCLPMPLAQTHWAPKGTAKHQHGASQYPTWDSLKNTLQYQDLIRDKYQRYQIHNLSFT